MKAGTKVKCIDDYMVEQHFTSEGIYTIAKVHPDGLHVSFSHTGDARWHRDRFEIIKEEPMKFSPKPGDKIICNNGEEFICCTLDFLYAKGIHPSKPQAILGFDFVEETWQDWDEDGYASLAPEDDYYIREVIPQNAENSADKEEEPRYTLQEIKEAWDASGWVTSTSSWGAFQKNLTKINSPGYQEYLRLKAIYE